MAVWKFLALLILFFGVAKTDVREFNVFPKLINSIDYDENEHYASPIRMYEKNLQNFSTWAHKMLDASSKRAFGVLDGNAYQMGNFDECLKINKPFATQYCIVTLRLNSTMVNGTQKLPESYGSIFSKLQKPNALIFQERNAVKMGLCLPESFQFTDIANNIKLKNPFKKEMVTYTITAHESLCRSRLKNVSTLQPGEIVFCAFTFLLVVLVIFVTSIDVAVTVDDQKALAKVTRLFSARRTWSRLFKGYENKETDFMDGIRTILMFGIIYAHQITLTIGFVPWMNGDTLEQSSDSRFIMVFEKLDLTVDVFLFMSGLLLSYNALEKRKDESINFFGLILLRYIRLIPFYVYVSYMYRALQLFQYGPLGEYITLNLVENCRRNWYWNFLLVFNFMSRVEDTCNNITWFIHCEFQLFVVGVLTVMLIKKIPKLGYMALTFLSLCSLVIPFAVIVFLNLKPFLGVSSLEHYFEYSSQYYTKPYTRASSYMVGLCGGIVYCKLSCKDYKLSQTRYYLIIGFSTLLIAMVLGYLPLFYNGHNHIVEMASYGALHRAVWSVAVLGMFVALSFGPPTSLARSFLSSSVWIPLSKVTYAAFMIQTFVYFVLAVNQTTILKMTYYHVITNCIIATFLTFSASLFLYVVVEIPMRNVFMEILSPLYSRKRRSIQALEKVKESD